MEIDSAGRDAAMMRPTLSRHVSVASAFRHTSVLGNVDCASRFGQQLPVDDPSLTDKTRY